MGLLPNWCNAQGFSTFFNQRQPDAGIPLHLRLNANVEATSTLTVRVGETRGGWPSHLGKVIGQNRGMETDFGKFVGNPDSDIL